jgi:L-cysteine S-thiosulfotransferase
MTTKQRYGLAALAAAALAAGCATMGANEPLDDAAIARKASAMMLASFRTSGIVAQERLRQDGTQLVCGEFAGKAVPKAVAEEIERREMSYIRFPADKRYMGNWRNGEAIAQSGRGLQFSDAADTPRGGNCYACHQISREELSFGTIGPSLLGYGKLRGTSEAIQQYTFGKISNPHAYTACSNMPRFGVMNILSQDQIRDLVALLLDPASPVNK